MDTNGLDAFFKRPFHQTPPVGLPPERAVRRVQGSCDSLVSVKHVYLRINFHGGNQMRAPRRM